MLLRSLGSLLLLAAPLAAQTAARPAALAAPAARPAGWQVRFDRPNVADSAMRIDQMGPGWHFYTLGRGSGIAWRPEQTASGNFKAELESALFPTTGEHTEGFGLIVGGQNLQADNQTYYYFLIRKNGQFLIKHRAGAETHTVVDWTPHAAIAQQTGQENARNTLAIEARADSVRFLVNGQRVHTASRQGFDVDGVVGVRVNHQLSVHVTRVTVTPL